MHILNLRNLNWEKIAAYSFLIFLIFTPLTYKIQLKSGTLQEGIYVEPLIIFLGLSVGLFFWSFWRQGSRGFLEKIKDFLVPHPIAKLFYILLGALSLSWIYGIFLTGNPALGDILRLVKHGLYFLIFPLSIRTGKVLGDRWTKGVLAAIFLVGMVAAAVSLWRIAQFVAAGNLIDFWVYNPHSRSVGFLGQYLDLATLAVGPIPKAAHATFGFYLAAVLGIGLVLFSLVKRMAGQVGALLGIGVIFAALLYTLSRGAVATGGLVVLAGLIWFGKNKRFWSLAVLAVVLFLELAVLVQLNPEVYTKFASTFPASQELTSKVFDLISPIGAKLIQAGQGTAEFFGIIEKAPAVTPSIAVVRTEEFVPTLLSTVDDSLGERVIVWGNTLDLLKSRPSFFVFGVGYSIDNLIHFTGGKVAYPHSLILDAWARGGLLALALIVAMWLLLFIKVVQFSGSQGELGSALGFVLLGFLTGWFLDNVFSGEQFFSDAPMLAFWSTFGFAFGLVEPRAKRKNAVLPAWRKSLSWQKIVKNYQKLQRRLVK